MKRNTKCFYSGFHCSIFVVSFFSFPLSCFPAFLILIQTISFFFHAFLYFLPSFWSHFSFSPDNFCFLLSYNFLCCLFVTLILFSLYFCFFFLSLYFSFLLSFHHPPRSLVFVLPPSSSFVHPACLRVSPDRSQFFRYDSVSLSCENQSNFTGWKVKRKTPKGGVRTCTSSWGSASSGSTCIIGKTYPSDSGVYWCQSGDGETSNGINITITGTLHNTGNQQRWFLIW